MSDKSGKKKSKKAAKAAAKPGVLGSLPATRPERIGRTRGATPARPKPARPKPKAAKPKVAKASATAAATPPRPVSAPEPEPPRRPSGPPRGTEVVTTAVQAVGEIGQIGVTVGRQLLKRATARLPRP